MAAHSDSCSGLVVFPAMTPTFPKDGVSGHAGAIHGRGEDDVPGAPRGDVCGMIRVTYSQCLVNAVLDLQSCSDSR